MGGYCVKLSKFQDQNITKDIEGHLVMIKWYIPQEDNKDTTNKILNYMK